MTTTATSEKQPGFLSVSKLGLKWAMMTQGRMVWLKDSTTPKISRGEVRRFLARLKFVDFPHKVRLCRNLWSGADCSGCMIASVLTQLGAFYEVGFKLTARWQAVSLGGDWTQCKAQLYFSSLTRRRILERIRGDNHKGLRDSQTELRGRAVVTCSNMAKQGSPMHPLPSGA